MREFEDKYSYKFQDGDTFDTWTTVKSIRAGEPPIRYSWSEDRHSFMRVLKFKTWNNL